MVALFSRRAVLLGTAAIVAGSGLAVAPRAVAETQQPRQRRNRALIVAVSEYPGLLDEDWLEGPNNDALLAHDYLTNDAPVPFSAGDVTVLASSLDLATAEPTLANIRGAMARLADEAQAGDFVYLHFAGHGIEQPARFPEQEVDGKDQVFLPRDVTPLTQADGHWPNGYVDKDIKADIDAIRQKGARVWAVFDCCHSATITRALDLVPEGEVARKLDLRKYGIPDHMWRQTTTRSAGGNTAGMRARSMFGDETAEQTSEGLAPMVAFFAAQTIEVTPELPLPRGSDSPVQMGLFSFALLSKLRENPRVSYRQLGQAIHHAYLGMNRTRPSPLFEGALDEPVFDSGDGLPYVPQWRIAGTASSRSIAAGHMHQLAPGTRLAVLAQPGDDVAQALGVVQVGSTTALRSQLAALSEDDTDADFPAIALTDIPDNAYALLVEQVVSFELTIARPRFDPADAAAAALVTEALEAIAADPEAPIRLRLAEPGADTDLRFDIRSEAQVAALMRAQGGITEADAPLFEEADGSTTPRLWLLDSSASLSLRPHERPYSRNLEPEDQRAISLWIRDALITIYRATNLARLARFDDFDATDLSVEVTRLPEFLSPLESGTAMAMHHPSVVQPGNTVHIRVENNSTSPVDLNIVFVGSDYSISMMLPDPVRLRARIAGEENAVFSEEVVEFNDSTFGREHLFVIATAAAPQENPLDLSFLSQGGIRVVQSRGAASSGFGAIIETMAGAATTRGGDSLAARRAATQAQRGAVYVYSVDNVPIA